MEENKVERKKINIKAPKPTSTSSSATSSKLSKTGGGGAANSGSSSKVSSNRSSDASLDRLMMQLPTVVSRYEPQELCLAYYGVFLYIARIVDVIEKPEATDPSERRQYVVHYQGWGPKYDEVLPASRLLKNTPENHNLRMQLKQKVESIRKDAQRSKSQLHRPSMAAVANKKQNNAGGDDNAKKPTDIGLGGSLDEAIYGEEVKFDLPSAFKRILIDDWDHVNHEGKLVPIPHETPLRTVFDNFISRFDKNSNNNNNVERLEAEELVLGLEKYFEACLGRLLLYSAERKQYQDVLTSYPGRPLSTLYGCEHLLRLFVKLPGLLVHTSISADELDALLFRMSAFVRYLQHSVDQYFVKNYVMANPRADVD